MGETREKQVVPLTCDTVALTSKWCRSHVTDRERSKPVPLTPEPDLDDAFLFRLKPGDNEPLSSLASRLHIVVIKQVRAQGWLLCTTFSHPLASLLAHHNTCTRSLRTTYLHSFIYSCILTPCHTYTNICLYTHT